MALTRSRMEFSATVTDRSELGRFVHRCVARRSVDLGTRYVHDPVDAFFVCRPQQLQRARCVDVVILQRAVDGVTDAQTRQVEDDIAVPHCV